MPAKPDPETTTIVIEGVPSDYAYMFHEAMKESMETGGYENSAEWFSMAAMPMASEVLTEDRFHKKLLQYRTEQNLLKKIEAENERNPGF